MSPMTRTAPARANAAGLLARLLADRADVCYFHADPRRADRDNLVATGDSLTAHLGQVPNWSPSRPRLDHEKDRSARHRPQE